MAMAGQFAKSVWVYNTWARLAGFRPVEWLTENIFDIGNAIVRVTPVDFEIIEVK